jgi:Zn-dependent protease
MGQIGPILQTIGIWALPTLFAVTVHEVAHGWVASKLGDKTAFFMGRLTLNPIKHIDILGTLILPIVSMIVGGFIFGWAKPVPVDWRNLRNPRRDMAVVAAAGPLSNLLMAFLWAFIAKGSMMMMDNGSTGFKPLLYMGLSGISVNIMFMILNFLPIPPLDGSRIVMSFLNPKWATQLFKVERYGFIVLIVLTFSGVLTIIMSPIYIFFQSLIFNILALT